jgi:hypothetical protein
MGRKSGRLSLKQESNLGSFFHRKIKDLSDHGRREI